MWHRSITRSVFLAALLFLVACKSDLNTNLPENDANEILAALLMNGISAEKDPRKDGVAIMVSNSQFGDAVEILRSYGLPRRTFSTVGDVFKAEGIVASPLQEWAKFNYAKAQELSETLSGIPGVIRADVHIGEERKESAFDEVEPPSASVLIQMDETMISENLVPEIKQLVSLAHPNIEYDRVGVVVTPVKIDRRDITLSEIGGVMIRSQDTRLVYYFITYSGAVTLLCIVAVIGFALQWRKRKAKEALA